MQAFGTQKTNLIEPVLAHRFSFLYTMHGFDCHHNLRSAVYSKAASWPISHPMYHNHYSANWTLVISLVHHKISLGLATLIS
jgi:hypothetical protein